MEFVLFKKIPKSRSVLFTQQFILYFFSYKTVFPPKTIPKSGSGSRSLIFRKGKTGNIAKLHRTFLVICSLEGGNSIL